jgi:hypothetical protein
MAVVRDPAFWRRFSVAVHLDEEAQTAKPELKHSYVIPSRAAIPKVTRPTNISTVSPGSRANRQSAPAALAFAGSSGSASLAWSPASLSSSYISRRLEF